MILYILTAVDEEGKILGQSVHLAASQAKDEMYKQWKNEVECIDHNCIEDTYFNNVNAKLEYGDKHKYKIEWTINGRVVRGLKIDVDELTQKK